MIPLKLIEVDEDIIPLIAWLNDLDGVQTDFCCQGELKKDFFKSEVTKDRDKWSLDKTNDHPYVIFHCTDKESLCVIMRAIGVMNAGTVWVEIDVLDGDDLRYMMVFSCKESLFGFIGLFCEEFDEEVG